MQPLVMGVVNVTPDSFADGGRYVEPARAVAHARDLLASGADVIDVGGESTRPGAEPVDEHEELRRVLPVLEALAGSCRLSIDTRHASVALAAVAAGASILNDVSGTLWPVAADTGAAWVAMHSKGDPRTMQSLASYDDVVPEVRDHLVGLADQATRAGVREVWIDPGIGFAKTAAHNLELLGRLDQLVATGLPVLVGASRKSFLGRLVVASDERVELAEGLPPAPVDQRVEASIAVAVWAIVHGAAMVRAHDVAATTQARTLIGSLAGSRVAA